MRAGQSCLAWRDLRLRALLTLEVLPEKVPGASGRGEVDKGQKRTTRMIEIRGSLVEAGHGHGRDTQRVPPILLSLKDAARALAVSDRSLWEWTKAGKVPHIRLGRRVLYSPDDLRRWVEGQRHGPNVPNGDAAPGITGNGA